MLAMFSGILRKAKFVNQINLQLRHFYLSASTQKIVQFLLSDIGEGIREVTVSEWFVKEGDKVSQFDNVCSVESDKASVNITSRYDGVIKRLYYNTGEIALVGKPLVDIDTPDDGDLSTSSSDEEIITEVKPIESPNLERDENYISIISNKSLATPAVRRIALENKVKLSDVMGTGRGGRVLKEDILNFLSKEMSAPSSFNTSVPLISDSVRPLNRLQKVMVNTMTAANAIPSFNYYEEIDVTKLIALRNEVKPFAEKSNLKITYMPFFIKALSRALKEFPILNSSLDRDCENVIFKEKHNIGFAVDTKLGLVVPNIKDVQSLSITGISRELNRILEEGKDGSFNPADLAGGTITVSNIGSIGGTYATPLILPPQVVIVALGKIQKKPIFSSNGELVASNILYTSWTADHRIIDGATLARFVSLWAHYIESPVALTLDL